MKKVVLFGATGHLGSYVTPFLSTQGYDVIACSRGQNKPYSNGMNWDNVQMRVLDRSNAETMRQLLRSEKPEVICDAICYTLEDAKILVDAIHSIPEYDPLVIFVGTIWVYEQQMYLPTDENHPKNATREYGRNKVIIEQFYKELVRIGDLKATIIHPGHISGRGWIPLNPQGNLSWQVFEDIKSGKPIVLPDDGSTTLHHVHVEDIARLIQVCIENQEKVIGQDFNITAEKAATLNGFAIELYKYFGKEPILEYLPWSDFYKTLSEDDAIESEDNLSHSPVCSMEKAKVLLGFEPKWSVVDTVIDSINSI